MSSRNRTIDYIKACMALLIMFYHYTTRYAEMLGKTPYPFRLSNGGTIGVGVFFIISSLFAIKGTTKADLSLFSYMLDKVKRLYPAYAISISLIFLCLKTYPIPELTVSIADYLINLTLIQRFIGTPAVDGAHWYLAFLLILYFWVWIFKRFGLHKKTTAYLLWLVISTLFSVDFFTNLGLSHLIIPINSKIMAVYNTIFMERHAASVIMGIMLYFLATGIGDTKYSVAIFLLAAVRNAIIVGVKNELIIVCLSLCVYLAYIGKLVLPSMKLLDFFAAISYCLYLTHQNLGYVVLDMLESVGVESEIAILVPALLSVGISAIIKFKIDTPIQYAFTRLQKT